MTRVLVLDDRPINLQFLTTLLSYKGFETREAADGVEGLEIAESWPFELAVVDIAMPRMDGIEFVRRLHADPRYAATPIIFYTASYEAAEARRMARQCGVTYVLMKPSEPEVILETIDQALGRSATPLPPPVPRTSGVDRLHIAAMRTSALIDFQLEIAAQRNAANILRILSHAARNVVASAHAVVEAGGQTFISCDQSACSGHGTTSRIRVSLATGTGTHGWLTLMERKADDHYTADDERIARTIAAQAAVAYENLDLYERVQREAELLRHNEARLASVARERELLLESTGEGIFAVDVRQRCTMVNRTAAALFGRPSAELLGSAIHDLVHHHTANGAVAPSECGILTALTTGMPMRFTDQLFWRNDNTSFPIEGMASPLIDEGVIRGVVVTFADVTERRQLEQRLEQIKRIDSLGRMAATIAHEFNNVLMGIQPFAEVIRRKCGDNKSLKNAAGHILNSVVRGKSITQDILRVSRAAEPQTRPVDVVPWLEQLASEIRALVGLHVHVDLDLPAFKKLCARCDPSQMQQVVTNLAVNARDAMGGEGTLRIAAESAGAMIRIVIADTGCGISPAHLPYIFEPLFTTKHSGTGLGLAVAQQIVLHNGGTIAVESTVGEGTRFQIELPSAVDEKEDASNVAAAIDQQLGVRCVVIVEDEPSVALGLEAILEAEGVEVHVVGRGAEAPAAVAEFDPDAVLLDMSLPDMSGAAVYEQLAARWPGMAVIFSTGQADESRVPRSSSRHVGFLRKPYSSEVLLTKLREVI